MEWSEFLNDVDLNSSGHVDPPSGKLLFNKVTHDVLECLSGYKECMKIATSLKDDIPMDTLNWFARWEGPVDVWTNEIISLEKQSRELPVASLEWPNLLSKLGEILTQVPQVNKEADILNLPSSQKLKLTIQTAIRLTQKLNLLWKDIQAKEYKRLWTIQQYGHLIK